jgi:DNA-binding NtrC family response regulator
MLVEPHWGTRVLLQRATGMIAEVTTYQDFETARRDLENVRSLDFLISNIKLDEYNGLHLVHLLAARGMAARSIVYTDEREIGLAKLAHRAGAFYETRECLFVALAAYLRGTLPSRDRRTTCLPDRRVLARGGRRCSDHHRKALWH